MTGIGVSQSLALALAWLEEDCASELSFRIYSGGLSAIGD